MHSVQGDAESVFPDQASLLFVHEVVETSVYGPPVLKTTGEGFSLGQPFDAMGLSVTWAKLEGLAAFPAWPRFRIAYRHVGGVTCREYRFTSKAQREHGEELVGALFEHGQNHRPQRVFRGWLDVPAVKWVGAPAWPTTTGVERVDYRQNARSDRSMICEVSDETSSLDRFMIYARYGASEYEKRVGDLALSETQLYRRQAGRIHTVERSTLRLRRRAVRYGSVDGYALYHSRDARWLESPDRSIRNLLPGESIPQKGESPAIYTFGRNLDVILYDPQTNPVAIELDKQLTSQT